MSKNVLSRFIASSMAAMLVLPMAGLTVVPSALAAYPQCSDGVDNDGNTQIDYPEDTQCSSLNDDTEGPNVQAVFATVTDNRDKVAPGNALVYLITLKQQRDTVQLVDVAFHAPAASEILSVSDDGSKQNGTVIWQKVAVFKNVTRTLSIHANVSPYAKPGQLLVAQVAAGGTTAQDTTLVAETTIPYAQNQLQVAISDHRDNALPGDTLEYVTSVYNPENTTATVHVQVKIPTGLQVTDNGGSTPFADQIVWQNITINPRETKIFSFRAKVDPRLPMRYPIQVVARAGNAVAYDRTITGGGSGPYNLFASITDNRTTANRGDLLTYVIHIDNASGRLETAANISASLPTYGEFVSANEGGIWDGNNVRWLRVQVAPGGTRDFTFTVRVRSDAPNGTTLRGTASVQGYTVSDTTQIGGGYSSVPQGPVSGNNQDLLVQKTASPTNAPAGSRVTYTVTVRNTDGRDVNGVSLIDTFDSNALSSIDAGSGRIDGNRIAWNVGTVRAGETRVFTYTGRLMTNLPVGATVTNLAQAFSTDIPYAPTGVVEQIVLPQTGIADDLLAPFGGMNAMLTPISSAAEGNGLPLIAWLAVIGTGLAAGMALGKKFAI